MTCFSQHVFTGVPLPPPPQGLYVFDDIVLQPGKSLSINVVGNGVDLITISLPLNPLLGQSFKFKDVPGNASKRPIRIQGTYALGNDLGIQLTTDVGVFLSEFTSIDGNVEFWLYQDFQAAELYWTGIQWGVR